jgi:hypothetical protein
MSRLQANLKTECCKSLRRSRVAMINQELAIAISAASFGMVVGFLTGYAVRAYISYLRHRSKE